MIWILYNLCFPIILMMMLPYFLFRMWRRGGYAKGFLQRVGLYDAALKAKIRERPRVWIHAVSVGETYVALQFMEEWRRDQAEVAFVMSVNTSTARVLAEKSLNPVDVLVYFPLDFSFVVRRVLNVIRPGMLVLTECEFWPNLIRQAKASACSVLLINGRMSDHSFRGYWRFRKLFSPVLNLVDCLCVQGDRDRQRYLALGVASDKVLTAGSAKYDVALKTPGSSEQAELILRMAGMSIADLILLGGSTWPGEEDALLDYFVEARQRYPGLKLVLVPRHAERRDDVVTAIQRRGLRFIQRSKGRTDNNEECPDVLLVDTTGELKHLYTAATVIFVGKSLLQHGGQNIIEPAACGKPVVVGPNMENFADITDEFKAKIGLIQVVDGEGLIRAFDELLSDGARREVIGNHALALVLKNRGSLKVTVQQAKTLLFAARGA